MQQMDLLLVVFLVEFVACVKRNEEETGKKKDIMMMGL